MPYNVSMRVSGNTLAEIEARAQIATDNFFGDTAYTSNVTYIQADQGEFDAEGQPTRFQADVQATSTEEPVQ